ncbi:hypothetical protein SeMB42_g07451 [Synchytrium endobioticum]|uniref:Uncharacterized protein n=1 Tax=Synchytrium endobioticum TaxID=286115 RepID=A0A507C7T8_9FUNG|nr:hypothetical protein SeMB42_g07451 [Synchytrium endobioticum]
MSPITHRATSQDVTTGSLPAPNPHAERRDVTEHLPQPPAEISVAQEEDLSVPPAEISVAQEEDLSVPPAEISVAQEEDLSVRTPAEISMCPEEDLSVVPPAEISVCPEEDLSVVPPAEISVCPEEDLSVVRVDKHSNVTSRMSKKLQQLKARVQSKRISTMANENAPLQVTGHRKVGRGYIYMVSWSNGDSYEVYKKDLRTTLLKQYWKRCDIPDQEKPTEFQNSRPRTQPQ